MLATLSQWTPAHVRLHPALPYAVCVGLVALHLTTAGRLTGGPVTLAAATHAADAWVVGDPSFRTLRDWLHRPVAEAPAAAASDGVGFYDFLQAHTNIARSVAVAPVPVALADLTGRRRDRARRTSSSSSSTACGATICRPTTSA